MKTMVVSRTDTTDRSGTLEVRTRKVDGMSSRRKDLAQEISSLRSIIVATTRKKTSTIQRARNTIVESLYCVYHAN
jgi:hypothetical protein